jgi:putative transposase
MLLARKLQVEVTEEQCYYFSHMNYAASKLWNLCNYEKYNWKELGLEEFPNWYYQKKKWKNNFWYKLLPSQTAQEVCKVLDKSWKSYNTLTKKKRIKNRKPPSNKKTPMPITYMQNGMKHNGDTVRLSLPITLKQMVKESNGIDKNFIYLQHKVFSQVSNIKQLMIFPPQNGRCDVVLNYEIEEPKLFPDNGKYLAIDLGIHNLATCYDSANSKTFIVGREYLAINHYFHKEIAKAQSALAKKSISQDYILDGRGVSLDQGSTATVSAESGLSSDHVSVLAKQPQYTSKRLKNLYKKRNNSIQDYLHKLTKFITNYCVENEINTVIIGDLTGIKNRITNRDKKYNQKLHELPYEKIRILLEYKLACKGINFVLQNECYTSQCAPNTPSVERKYANKLNRVQRGLYVSEGNIYNADAVGAYNILRKYCDEHGIKKTFSIKGLTSVKVFKIKR